MSTQQPAVSHVSAVGVARSGAVSGALSAYVPVRHWLTLMSDQWVPRLMWSMRRTGRLGLSGLALLAAGLVFLLSTYLPLSHEVEDLRLQLQAARIEAAAAPRPVADSGAALLRSLPMRAQVPALLGVLLKQADAAHLRIDSGKYETSALKSGGVVSYQVSFPVTGPYPQVRQFIDASLVALPAAALSELSLSRKSIGEDAVEAQIRLTVFTRDAP